MEWFKRVMLVVGALVTLGGAATGVVTAVRAGWSTAKAAGTEEATREDRLRTVESDTKELKGDVRQLKAEQHTTSSRLQRIEDSQSRAEETWRDVKDELKEQRRLRH